MKYTSKLLQDTVEAFSALPGIGRKSALRIALHLAKSDVQNSIRFAHALTALAENLKTCKNCYSYSDFEICEICSNPVRDPNLICVVETIRDLMAIEETRQFKGMYHVLNGLISPVDGIGPEKLNIDALLTRIKSLDVKELIMAIRPSIEGDTTVYYLTKQLNNSNIKISMIARGIAFGSELEYADEFTLGRSITERTPYQLHSN
ncbi:MAG: recombination mediator RecR [Saprospiraceae bacterium]